MGKLFFCGEALIDFVPVNAGANSQAFLPKTGGSLFNAAKAAACVGGDAWFIGALSDDMFGQQLFADLIAHGVNCDLAVRSHDPTTLAFVEFSTGHPRYAFFNNDTATRNISFDTGLLQPKSDDILQVGSIALIDGPGADNITRFCMGLADKMMVSVDPNVRPLMIRDRKAWDHRIGQIMSVASIIRLSDEDLAYMAPDATADSFASAMIKDGVKLVIVTLGEKGAVAFTARTSVRSSSPQVDFCDAVGAGDALMGAVLGRLDQGRNSTAETLNNLNDSSLRGLLDFATTAAALNCTKPGAAPAKADEIIAFQRRP